MVCCPNGCKGTKNNGKSDTSRDAGQGKFQSGQMGQTVNLLAYAFGGSNPSLPTENMRK